LGLRQAAVQWAQEAAGLIQLALADRARWQGSRKILIEKAPGDWSSELDATIEEHLRKRVLQRHSDHGFFGEEGHEQPFDPQAVVGAHSAAAQEAATVWIVDPIDGSANFLRGYPQFSVSIAAVRAGEPVAGCVLDPLRQECFSAAQGHGAQCNGQALKISDTTDLMRALAGTVFPKPRAPFMDSYLDELASAMRGCGGVRRSGSMALEMAYLAAGRLDVFWERGMGAWDAAAGVLLIREAGGEVWTLDGLPWWQSQALAAATPGLRRAWANLLA
jgi:myo-inositol-1(or 4)-monophosphatase